MAQDRRRLGIYVALGVAAGIVYGIVDAIFDAQIVHGRLGALAPVHEFLDHVLPVLTGALLGAVWFAVGQRGRLARLEHERAEGLRLRVQKLERDQAVWVLAATILHEVKNPLHALGLLLDELSADGASRSLLVERAQSQIDRIADRLKALRSLQSQEVTDSTPLALADVVTTAADDVRQLADGAELAVTVRDRVVARGDADRVRLIVRNLVDNALHAAATGGHGHVEVEVTADREQAVVLVRDDGPGPAPEAVSHMFDPLRGNKPGGLGLGLAVARALAQAMDGDVRYDGRSAGWTTFRLSLPREAT